VSVPSAPGLPPTQVPIDPEQLRKVAQLKGKLEAAQSRLAEAPAGMEESLTQERNAALLAYLAARRAAYAAVDAAAAAAGMRRELWDDMPKEFQ